MVIRYLIEKEFKQMFRNKLLPILFVLLPISMVVLLPKAATQEVKNINITVVDNDHSPLSQRLIGKLSASQYFNLDALSTHTEAMKNVESGSSLIIVYIEPNFEKNLIVNGISNIKISANAVDGVKAGLGQSYLMQIMADFSAQLRQEKGYDGSAVQMAHCEITPRYLFNAQLDYKRFMIPGLISMLLILLVGFLPALNIVGEKEKGTIEQINVTPVGRMEFIFSKLIPYWIVGLVLLSFAMLLAWQVYDIVPAGNIAVIYLFATLFILIMSSFGLIISNYSDTTQQASLVMFFFLIIFLLMSGLLTPIAGMPEWAKVLTALNPMRYFIEVMRCLYLKGSTFNDLLPCFWPLTIYACIVGPWAIFTYKKNS